MKSKMPRDNKPGSTAFVRPRVAWSPTLVERIEGAIAKLATARTPTPKAHRSAPLSSPWIPPPACGAPPVGSADLGNVQLVDARLLVEVIEGAENEKMQGLQIVYLIPWFF